MNFNVVNYKFLDVNIFFGNSCSCSVLVVCTCYIKAYKTQFMIAVR